VGSLQASVQLMNGIDPRIEQSLRDAHSAREERGDLLSAERLQAGYSAFRSRFGPDALKSLDGLALLNTMHTHGNKESLVYWLEFKNDEELVERSFSLWRGPHDYGIGTQGSASLNRPL
jgi:5-methylcytosine-specific restriction protein B